MITFVLCLGRAKSHSSGEWLPRQTALLNVLKWSSQLLSSTICTCLACSSRRKSKTWVTEVSQCAVFGIKSDGLCCEPYQPLFSACFCKSFYSNVWSFQKNPDAWEKQNTMRCQKRKIFARTHHSCRCLIASPAAWEARPACTVLLRSTRHVNGVYVCGKQNKQASNPNTQKPQTNPIL